MYYILDTDYTLVKIYYLVEGEGKKIHNNLAAFRPCFFYHDILFEIDCLFKSVFLVQVTLE